MIERYQHLLETMMIRPELRAWGNQLPDQINAAFDVQRNGHLRHWMDLLNALPAVEPQMSDFHSPIVSIGSGDELTDAQRRALYQQLQTMCPWRKGPFRLFGVDIDTEWRSDMKWARVVSALSDLRGRTVLDVGCGNGYYLYRMKGAGAENVIGVDPYLHFVVQSLIFAHFLGHDALPVLPLAAEQIPDNLEAFDTVFSMGILYHRRSPFEHLFRLKAFLRPGGELVLETLVIEGKEGEVLVPEGRYAKMNNVWFIPSVDELVRWLKRCGFVSIQVADCSVTTPDEQRRTDWMRFESLTDYLDPLYSDRTVEGYPAPRRAVLIAQKPE